MQEGTQGAAWPGEVLWEGRAGKILAVGEDFSALHHDDVGDITTGLASDAQRGKVVRQHLPRQAVVVLPFRPS